MFNFKTAALAALTAATALAPTAQAGFVQDGIKFHTPDDFKGAYAEIVEKLWELEVAVIDGRDDERLCEKPKKEGSYTLGWYTPEKDFMVICYGDDALRAETLAHEAVHVFQDCRDGLGNAGIVDPNQAQLKFIGEHLSENKAQLIVELYDKEDWKIEAEAFLLEDHPQEVSNQLSKVCGASFKF